MPKLLEQKSHVHLHMYAEHNRDGMPDRLLTCVSTGDYITASFISETLVYIGTCSLPHGMWDEDSQVTCGETQKLHFKY